MTRSTLATALAIGLAALVAARFEGATRMGVLGGALFGAGLAMLGAVWLRHWAKVDSRRVMRATGEGYLFLLGGLMIAALALRFVPAAGEVLDWQAFLVAYAAAALLPLFAGAIECAGMLTNTKGSAS